jgi:hypothetical protein
MIRKRFRFKRLVLGLAFATLAVPATAIAGHEPAYLQYHSVTPGVTSPQVRTEHSSTTPTITGIQADGMRLNALADWYRQQEQSAAVSERSFGVPGPDPSYAPLVVTTTTSDGFSWQDAGIGASIALGIALMLVTAVALGRRRSGLDETGLTSA